jgi:fused signal recognition particle receptor
MFNLFRRKPAPTPAPAPGIIATPDGPAAYEPEIAPIPAAQNSPISEEICPEVTNKSSWLSKLKSGLANTREKLGGGFAKIFANKKLDEETLETLETTLLTADVGVAATSHLIADLRRRYKAQGGEAGAQAPKELLADAMTELLTPLEAPLIVADARPYVIMVAGVNGAGKTTTIGKLAKHFQNSGYSVLLAAGDTFRAAAREQLVAWGERNNVQVIQQQGGDPAAVMFDAVQAAKARGIDVVIADTAGRLPTQLHLMEEIKKAKRVLAKADAAYPHETLLVLDGNTGQNAVMQVKAFDDALQLTGLVMTKLDGSAKGGVLCAIAKERPVPLKFIGVGEGIDDLQPFVAREFVGALVG